MAAEVSGCSSFICDCHSTTNTRAHAEHVWLSRVPFAIHQNIKIASRATSPHHKNIVLLGVRPRTIHPNRMKRWNFENPCYRPFSQITEYWIWMRFLGNKLKKKQFFKAIVHTWNFHFAFISKSHRKKERGSPCAPSWFVLFGCSSPHYLFTFIGIISLCLRVICALIFEKRQGQMSPVPCQHYHSYGVCLRVLRVLRLAFSKHHMCSKHNARCTV